ncbi:hypothetical protein [Myroides sp. TSA_177.3]|uniref:hypothetical protein n=1 Tax=Myroides sp. TSA_177.3 TaxID=3415650 RepID=UPI004045E38C
MENKKQKFQELIKKMETLKETEKGKLRGGFTVLSSSNRTGLLDNQPTNYFQCTCDNYKCS